MTPAKPRTEYKFHHGGPIDELFQKITVRTLRDILTATGKFKTMGLKTRDSLYHCIEQSTPPTQDGIFEAVLAELQAGRGRYGEQYSVEAQSSTLETERDLADFKFHHGGLIHKQFVDCTVKNLRSVARRLGDYSSRDLESRNAIYGIIEQSDSDVQDSFIEIVSTEQLPGKARYGSNSRKGKHKRSSPEADELAPSRATKRLRSDIAYTEETNVDEPLEDDERIAELLRSDTDEVIADAMATFIEKTNNAAVTMCCCACCAREWNCEDVYRYKISDIPNKDRLIPAIPHPKHDIYEGALLHPPAMNSEGEADICSQCNQHLLKDQLPKYALANGLWVGAVPRELANLTIPERMLIAKYYPAACIIKLYPKKGSGGWKKNQLHNGLRGNVSTYILDPKLVASMVEGPVMPPKPIILSATIGITFIGPKGLPESTMPGMFRVRRERIRKALLWLKENNPLYSDIVISEARLQELPVNRVPEELMRTAKYSFDVDDEDVDLQNQDPVDDADLMEVSDEHEGIDIPPAILPLHSLGVVDVEGIAISDQELMAHALANTAQQTLPEDYRIRRGSAFVNEYARTTEDGQRNDGGPSNPSHLLGCFPTLFPYGQGGFEIEHEVEVAYENHGQYCCAYQDKRFRLDPQFIFQVFSVCQKRQVCRSAVLQMKKSTFSQNIRAISKLTGADFLQASKEETRGIPFSNPGIRALRKQLSAIRTRVTGTDESRAAIRSKIWGMNLAYNPPSLWITINPADSQDPIAQVLAGVAIDLDSFCNTAGPDNEQRGINIASDPYASAKFFHFTIETILAFLFGIKKKREGTSHPEGGVLGKVQGYIGTVEAQGRGTLHLHMLIWLKDAPSSSVMEAALQSEAFRERIKSYIKAVIRADVDELSHDDVLRLIPKEPAISYSRPLDPKTTDATTIAIQERKLARTVQLHKCTTSTCLKMINGRLRCKRRAPFKIAPDDWVEASGEWGPKRFCGYFNNWNPTLLRAIRANHDVKLILNGGMTKSVTWYITNYATKKQQRSTNVTAVIAKKYAFHKENEKRNSDLKKANRLLIQRCANALSSCHEFSAPEIMSYIMGWGDRYESHTFAPIYWDSAMIALKHVFPELLESRFVHRDTSDNTERSTEDEASGSRAGDESPPYEMDSTIAFIANSVQLKDQLKDYKFRGDALEDFSLFEFVVETYEGQFSSSDVEADNNSNGNDFTEGSSPRIGRPRSVRVPYKPDAGKPKMCRVIRAKGHDTVPRIVGKWFSRSDETSCRELYCASMAMLLKPWRSISELKRTGETFEDNWNAHIPTLSVRAQRIVDNIQYFHECADSARDRKLSEAETSESAEGLEYEYEADGDENQFDEINDETYLIPLTEQDVEDARDKRLHQ